MIKRSLLLSLLLVAGGLHAQDQAPDLAKAKQTAETLCVGCHGADGNSPVPVNPNLAGQHADYLFKQLKDFKGWNGKPAVRENPIMGGMVAALEEADMKALAMHFSSQTLQPDSSKNADLAKLGQNIWRAGLPAKGVPACAGCHGPAGAGLPAQFPRIGGQHADYTEAQLKAFRDGVRKNDPAQMMQTIALKMTDPEMKAVADYAAGLR
ncbi:c-type cytochrome [Aromatoleum toluvorans]|uniref:C-type cytochrome n=1 Tax=Aromatoleum toluvorans TaxID=92002 RepID=A0ABX1PYS6_9RHOO|nr:c-type cytochrome [Aromatoleum toluvorans]NMG44518.1 c-type cytochrome [Aromatoleum toluvorans]